MTDPELDALTCPHCAGPRQPDDAGPGWVTFICCDCGRSGREEVVEP